MKKYDATIAGYFCVDLIPGFKGSETHADISEVLKPGKLIEIDGLNATLGGVVANTGMAMNKFSKNVFLNGIIGDDFIGKIAREWLDKYQLSEGINTLKGGNTAFGLVIAPPGVDRIFLESPGCSKVFDISHINFEAVAQSRLFHFGYPPLLRHFYLNEGEELLEMFSRIQDMNVVTSLDFSLPDPNSESGNVDWPKILQRVLPFTDIFVPSLEEALQIMMPEEYARIQMRSDFVDVIDQVPLSLIQELGRRIIDNGVKIVLLKSGYKGAYLFAGDISSLNKKHGFDLSEERWNYASLLCKAYPVDESKIKNASGAGDTSAAAFLSAILDGEGPESSLKYAAIAGRNNLYCFDIFKEIDDWTTMTEQIKSESHDIVHLNQNQNKSATYKILL
ncbi:MAG: carbohydrate kinase family protein [Ginsengibacter sp.]